MISSRFTISCFVIIAAVYVLLGSGKAFSADAPEHRESSTDEWVVGLGETCGGDIMIRSCKSGLTCIYDSKLNGRYGTGARGKCGIASDKCFLSMRTPVCGINNETYENECLLNRANVELLHQGPCRRDKFIVNQ